MKLLLTVFGLLSISSTVFAGGSSSSGGSSVGQMMQVMKDQLNTIDSANNSLPKDYIRSLGRDADGSMKFQFKPFDSASIQNHRLQENDISLKYLRAIENSEVSHQWEAVPIK